MQQEFDSILREMFGGTTQQQQQPSNQEEIISKEVYLTNVPYSFTKHDFTLFIRKNCPGLKKFHFPKNSKDKSVQNRGYAILSFNTIDNAKYAVSFLHNYKMDGRKFIARLNIPKKDTRVENCPANDYLFSDMCCLCFQNTCPEHLSIIDVYTNSVIRCTFLYDHRRIELCWSEVLDPEFRLIGENKAVFKFTDLDRVSICKIDKEMFLMIRTVQPPHWYSHIAYEDCAFLWDHISPKNIIDGRATVFAIRLGPRDNYINIPKHASMFGLYKESEKPIKYYFEQCKNFDKMVKEFKQNIINLEYAVQFKLYNLISENILHECNVTDEFLTELHKYPKYYTLKALEYMLSKRKRLYDPLFHFKKGLSYIRRISFERKLPPHCVLTDKIIFTPSRMVCLGPEIDTTNRVIRHFSQYQDRFARVSFSDEDYNKFNLSNSSIEGVLSRVRSILKKGFTVADRKYEFLAFSSSQLCEHSCWFFSAPPDDPSVTCDSIRQWMGDFGQIKNAAKYAARMGQCFSSTTATCNVEPHEWCVIPDIERNGYVFSDGIGKISVEFAKEVNAKLAVADSLVAAYQIRFGGAKGVVAIDPTLKTHKLQIRPSMLKFNSDHGVLEVIGVAKDLPCYLNRQVITLLSTLYVDDKVFENLHSQMLNELNSMLQDSKKTANLLRKYFGDTISILNIADLLQAGFPVQDPYIYRIVNVIRIKRLQELKAKTRIFVPKGTCLMGTLDEYQLLKYGEVYINTTKYGVFEGPVMIAKNPCFHPGDCRIFEAVDVEGLSHMVNCVVFPSVGERPHPNELSGSDLDGDLYFITWDEGLCDIDTFFAMDYDASVPKELLQVTMDDLFEFFTDYIENDNLGVIANAHLAIADDSRHGAFDERCLKLAALHSVAVDYPKTGVKAKMDANLRVDVMPDFMENKHKPSRPSDKVIGRLYRQITIPEYKQKEIDPENSMDESILVSGYEAYWDEATLLRDEYNDELITVMNAFRIYNEAELISGCLLEFPAHLKQKQYDFTIRVNRIMQAFQQKYRNIFNENVYTPQNRRQKAYAWYRAAYERAIADQQKGRKRILLSFGYVAYKDLISIRTHNKPLELDVD
jgi:RNA-dependent RNA polymerase